MSLQLKNSAVFDSPGSFEFTVPAGVTSIWASGTAAGGGSGPDTPQLKPEVTVSGSFKPGAVVEISPDKFINIDRTYAIGVEVTSGSRKFTTILPASIADRGRKNHTKLLTARHKGYIFAAASGGLVMIAEDGSGATQIVPSLSQNSATFIQGSNAYALDCLAGSTDIDVHKVDLDTRITSKTTFASSGASAGGYEALTAQSQYKGGLAIFLRKGLNTVLTVDDGVMREASIVVNGAALTLVGCMSTGARKGVVWGASGGNSYIYATSDGGQTFTQVFSAAGETFIPMYSTSGGRFVIFRGSAQNLLSTAAESTDGVNWSDVAIYEQGETGSGVSLGPGMLVSGDDISFGYNFYSAYQWVIYYPEKRILRLLDGSSLGTDETQLGYPAVGKNHIIAPYAPSGYKYKYLEGQGTGADPCSIESSEGMVLELGGGKAGGLTYGGSGGSSQGRQFVPPTAWDGDESDILWPGQSGGPASTSSVRGGAGSYAFGPEAQEGKRGLGPGSGGLGKDGYGGGGAGETATRYPIRVTPGEVLTVQVGSPGGPGTPGTAYVTLEWP